MDGLKNKRFAKLMDFADQWFCDQQTALMCYKSFTRDLIDQGLIDRENEKVIGKLA